MENKMIEQRSPEWHAQRLGKFTASTFGDLMKKGRAKEAIFTATGESLLMEKLAEQLTGEAKPMHGAALDWGTELEPEAIKAYEELLDVKVEDAPFVPLNGYESHAGGSPDGYTKNGIIEVKCPFNSANHIHALLNKEIPKKSYQLYYTQIQFNMLCTGKETCDFISYDPRMLKKEHKIVVIKILRDEEYIEEILKRLDLSIKTMATMKENLV